MIRKFLGCLLLVLGSVHLSVQAEGIDYEKHHSMILGLIEKVRGTEGAIFIRNGSEHSPEEAADHLQRKYKNVREGFWPFSSGKELTVHQFIEHIASESSTSGKPYKIKLGNGDVVMSKDWFNKQLECYPNDQDRPCRDSKLAPRK